MRSFIIACLSLFLTVLLTSCAVIGGLGGSTAQGPAETTSPSPLSEDYENALPALAQLVVGTFRLEDTDLAVDAAQAADLLSLWKGYRILSSSDSTAVPELVAVLSQIQETMTADQLQAISDMHLTNNDLAALMQEQGIEMGQVGGFGDLSPEEMATRQAQRDAGDGAPIPGVGGGPGGGSGVPGEGGPAPSTGQSAPAQAQGGSGTRAEVSPLLIDALISSLGGEA